MALATALAAYGAGKKGVLPPPPPGTVGIGTPAGAVPPPPLAPNLIGPTAPIGGQPMAAPKAPPPKPSAPIPPLKPPKKGDKDFTDKLSLQSGMNLVFPIYQGIDTRWKEIGDYDFIVHVDEASPDGYAFTWNMTYPANQKGFRNVPAADVKSAERVSLFYPDKQSCTLVGTANIVRVSDAIYQALKTGMKTAFELDGPETDLRYHHEITPVPHSIQGTGVEYVPVLVNSFEVKVRAIRAVTDNGWTYWIMDNPRFPIMLRGDGPFKWTQPQFGVVLPPEPLDQKGGGGPSTDEGKSVIDQLEKKGKATTYAILFDFDKAILRDVSKPVLKKIAEYLKSKQQLKIVVEGHTDSIGGYDYNMKLSQRRAEAVKNFLVSQCGIKADRLTPKGMGYTQPVADNGNPHGRQLNRRVVFKKM